MAADNPPCRAASRPLGAGVANVMRMAGVDLQQAIEIRRRSTRPGLLGLKPAELAVGSPADFIQFHLRGLSPGASAGAAAETGALEILANLIAGQVAFGTPWSPAM